jgi:hypothetical protein
MQLKTQGDGPMQSTTTLKIATASFIISVSLACDASASRHVTPNQMCDNSARCFGAFQYAPQPATTRYAKKKKHYSRHAKHKRKHRRETASTMPWNMVKVKTVQGIYITVHPAYAHKFLRLFEILAENKVNVPKDLVGCYARGHHVRGSNHYIGAACDIQTGWNRTIPAMYHAGKWIKEAGLYDGCSFGDCGHVESIRGTHNKPPDLYTSLAKFKSEQSTANYQP